MSPTIAALVVAAGSGARAPAESGVPKQYRPLAGQPILARTIDALLEQAQVSYVLPVINSAHASRYDGLKLADPRLLPPAIGGATRQASVLAGLEALADTGPEFVLIHDAARPFAGPALIGRVIAAAAETGAALPALPVTDTIKQSADGTAVTATLDRTTLFAAQTPQGFAFAPILAAHRKAAAESATAFTDDAAIAEWAGMHVRLVAGDPHNVKLTFAGDLAEAERRLIGEPLETRVGSGFDVHSFMPGDHVMLAGVRIAHTHALKGHSDADVGLHALADAVLGALGEGDIGTHFPASDPQWKAADSARFLGHAAGLVAARRHGRIVHLDLTLICEAPKIAPHAARMRARIAAIAGIDAARVSVKATTTEGLGFVGRGEGIAATAAATIELPRDG